VSDTDHIARELLEAAKDLHELIHEFADRNGRVVFMANADAVRNLDAAIARAEKELQP